MKIFTRPLFLLLVLSVMAVSSCRTYEDNDITPDTTGTGTKPGTGGSTENSNQVTIAFPKTSLDINTTDSVVAVFTNGTTTIRKKATKGGTFYILPLNGVYAGTWQTNFKVYMAPTSATDPARMYRYETNLNTAVSTSLVAPTGKLADTWKPNLFFISQNYGVKFAVAVLPSDPYYELFLPQTLINYKNIYIERYVYKTIDNNPTVIQYGNITLKAAEFKGFNANTNAFGPFAKAMVDVPWDSTDVSLQLYNDSGNDFRILFSHTTVNK
ncbi:hypothetical protein ABDD95_18000 [Mucilaginibacter sp. PAMB04274]|uniref:hypothetical protein n=1 Tax=Mucilaginibacter sp. PAMB04274 TaxID=3138568 RepID=UPI0031F705CA